MKKRHSNSIAVNRRELLKLGLITGSTFVLPVSGCAKADTVTGARSGNDLYVNSHLLVTENNELVVLLDRVEMGQGVERAFARIVASELNIPIEDIIVRNASIGQHQNPLLSPPPWGTAGSDSIRWAWKGLRLASAQLRALFLQAAAMQNNIAPEDCSFERLSIRHGPSNTVYSLASLIQDASTLPIPNIKLSSTSPLIKETEKKGDYFYARSTGKLRYGSDIELPDLLTGLILKPPGPKATLRNYHVTDPGLVPASVHLLKIDSSLVVVANNYWEAKKASEAIEIEWHIPDPQLSSVSLHQNLQNKLDKQWSHTLPSPKSNESATTIERDFFVPYLAHFCMEPMNCTVWYQKDYCEVWAPTQKPSAALKLVQSLTGLKPEQVNLHVPALGGGFGQRLGLSYVREATLVSMQLKKPVKLIYSRQSDLWGDTFRPAAVARCRAEFNPAGELHIWHQQVVSSQRDYRPQPGISDKVINWGKLQAKQLLNYLRNKPAIGATSNHYPIRKVDYPELRTGEVVPTGAWRSVENSYMTFFHECFLDEIAEKLNLSPFEYRKTLTTHNGRLNTVLRQLGILTEQNESPQISESSPNKIGFALFQGYESYCGAAIEITQRKGKITIENAWLVADVGTVIDRSGLIAQLEGGFLFGLCAAIHGELKISSGRYAQSNFHNYPVLRISEMPTINITIIDSDASPGGAGELATPLAAPALANALFQMTGQRTYRLPITL